MSCQEPMGPLGRAWTTRPRPRPGHLPVPPAGDRTVWGDNGTIHAATVASSTRRAETLAGEPWPLASATSYLRYQRDGNRVDYEDRVRGRQERLSVAAVAAATTLDDRWIDEVVDGVVVLCEQSSWCWPAHDDAPMTTSSHLPDPARPFLDLGAGEVLGQLAWIDWLLGRELDRRASGLRDRIRHEADRRAFEPFVSRRDWHWLGADGDVDNWNPWIHGNLAVAALALVEEPDRQDGVIRLALDGIDRYIASLPADGAIDEGYSYWWNGPCRALETTVLLTSVYPGITIEPVPALRATLDFPQRMHLGGPWFISLGDARARPDADAPWHALFRVARAFGATEAARFAASRRPRQGPIATPSEGFGRFVMALTDPAWHLADSTPPGPASGVWLPSVQVGIAREAPEALGPNQKGLTVVAKGGHNGEHHNHLDVGSVIIAVGGTPLIIDPGRPTYTKHTFSDRRYETWTMQSGWHSVPAIAGSEQGIGVMWGASDASWSDGVTATEFSYDIAGAYPAAPVAHWHRTVRLDRLLHTVIVSDSWDPIDHHVPSLWHWILSGIVDGDQGTVRVRSADGTAAALEWNPALPSLVEERTLNDPMLQASWGSTISRLTISIPHTRDMKNITLTVREAT